MELYEHDDDDDDDKIVFFILLVAMEICSVTSRRYSVKRQHRKQTLAIFAENLGTGPPTNLTEADIPFLKRDDFLHKFRMRVGPFQVLVDKIRNHAVFRRGSRGPPQAPPEYQLMVLLQALGSEGCGYSNQHLRQIFQIGRGIAQLYFKRARAAILSLRDEYVRWPDENKRKETAKSILARYGFPNCVGMVDGTLHPLTFAPRRGDAADFSGRKFAFSLSTMLVCDENRRITHVQAGWAGSAHDNQIMKDSLPFQQPNNFFGPTEYLLGDSAYDCTPFLISALRKSPATNLTHKQTTFNDAMAKPRSLVEHTIGVWKARFPFLKGIRCSLTDDPDSLREILYNIEATVVLHNFLIDQRDEAPDEWGEFDQHDAPSLTTAPLCEHDVLDCPVGGLVNTARRSQLCHFINHS